MKSWKKKTMKLIILDNEKKKDMWKNEDCDGAQLGAQKSGAVFIKLLNSGAERNGTFKEGFFFTIPF